MQPGRQYNAPQTFGMFFPQSSAPQQFQPALGPPVFQTYGSGGTQYFNGQPFVSVGQRYPPPHIVPAQNYNAFIGPPPSKPFPEQPFNQFQHQPPGAPPMPINPVQPPPPSQTPPHSQILYPSPGSQGPPSQYAWSTAVTPPSPFYTTDSLNAIESELEPIFDGVSPMQSCKVSLLPQPQYMAQEQSSSFNPDLSAFAMVDNRDVFKQKASRCGINIQSPPNLEEIKTNNDISNNNEKVTDKNKIENNVDIKNNFEIKKTDFAGVNDSGKRPREDETDTRLPLTLPAKTVAQRNLSKQKVREDWWSLSNTSSLSESRKESLNFQENISLGEEISSYSSFPDSAVDLSKVLAESSMNSNVTSKCNDVFDESVDYIEEHEFLSYDVTSSPFSPYDTDEEHEENGCLETRGQNDMPESPVSDDHAVAYNIITDKQAENSEVSDKLTSDQKVLLRYQKELEISEIKKMEILESGSMNSKNLEMLASAIVTQVIAKAVIEVISSSSGDRSIEENTEVKEIGSLVDVNLNTNAETDSSKTNSEMRMFVQQSLDMKNFSEDNENVSPNTERQRLYSWPYINDTRKEDKINEESQKNTDKVFEVSTPSRCHKVKITVEQNVASEEEKFSAGSIAETLKSATESSKDFERFYFKQKAFQHGIKIVSPLRNAIEIASVSSESDLESEKGHQNKRNVMEKTRNEPDASFDETCRSQSESSDYQSLDLDSQTDPAFIFKQKASKLGIKIQNPKETIEISENSDDTELEKYTSKNKDLHLKDPTRSNTSTPEPFSPLNPESPEFRPGLRRRMEKNIQTSRKEMRAEAPEFNPSSLSTSSLQFELRSNGPEFNSANFSLKTTSQQLESLKKTDKNNSKAAKIFHLPAPKTKVEKPSIGIQASPKISDCSVNTRRVKTKDCSIETSSCDSREVCVNTDFPGNIEAESHTLPVKAHKHFVSKCTNTDVPKRRSLAISVNMGGGYQECKKDKETGNTAENMEKEQLAMAEQIKSLQVEVMKHRANLHLNRICMMQNKIEKETAALTDTLMFSNDKLALDAICAVTNGKINMLEDMTTKINTFLEETISKIRAGVKYKTLPDFTFFSEDPETNRVIANQQLFELATKGFVQENQQPSIKIDFSPTNQNLIEFTAKPNPADGRTPERVKNLPSSVNRSKPSPKKPVKVAATFSPGLSNKPSCVFVNKDDFGSLVDDTEVPEGETMLVNNFENIDADDIIQGKEKSKGGLMDLDLDSDDEVTEISTVLTDDDELSYNHRACVGEVEVTNYPDLKDIISSKMNEVYGDISEYNTFETSAKENNFAEETVHTSKQANSANKENASDSVRNKEKRGRIDQILGNIDNYVKNAEKEHKNAVKADAEKENDNAIQADVVVVKTDATAIETESGSNEQSENTTEYDRKNLVEVDQETEMKTEEVPENWEGLELDEVYISPEVVIDSADKSGKESNAPVNTLKELIKADAKKSAVEVNNNGKEEAVSEMNSALSKEETDKMQFETSSEMPSSVQNEPNLSSEIETSVQVTPNVTASLTTSVALTSAPLLAGPEDTSLSAMSMLQPGAANAVASPLMMNNVNPMLYQMVFVQLVKAYPALAANPDTLSQLALQQTSLLQHYIATNQISAANMTAAISQGTVDGAGVFCGIDQPDMSSGASLQASLGLPAQLPVSISSHTISSGSGEGKTKDCSLTDSNVVKASTNQSNEGVDTPKKLGAVKNNNVNVSDAAPGTNPVPYRPPGLRALDTSPGEKMFQSTTTSKTSVSVSNPLNTNINNSASAFGDLSKPLRRPFKQHIPLPKARPTESSDITKDIIYDSKPVTSLASGPDDIDKLGKPPSRPVISAPRLPSRSDISESVPPKSDNSDSRPPSRSNIPEQWPPLKPNIMESKPLPVSFNSVTYVKPVFSSQSYLSMQVPKSTNVSQSSSDSSKPGNHRQYSPSESSKHPDFLPQYAKRHSPELRDKVMEAPSRDFLPSFVKSISSDNNNLTENQQSFQDKLPPRFRRMSAPQRQSSTEEENWDNDTLWQSNIASSQMKNSAADLTNPLMGRSTPSPSLDEGTSGLSDIPLPKKLRVSKEKSEKEEREEEKEEWCEVTTKKKKQKELKKFVAPYVYSNSTAPVKKTQVEREQIQGNFERLIQHILDKYPASGRSDAIESVTRLREQKGGTLKGMSLNEILSQAGHILEQQQGKMNNSAKIPGLWTNSSRLTPPKLNLPPANHALGHREDEEICVICHDPLSFEETKALDCGHVFHSECIGRWVYGRERTCPTCRQHALFPEEFPRLGK